MAPPGLKEEAVVARPQFRWAAAAGGGERGLVAAVAPAVTASARFVTLKVQDAQRRVVTRTMRRTDKLQVLMDHYYDMVCPASAGAGAGTRGGAGRFVFDGKPLRREQTAADLGMKSGDRIDFFGDVEEKEEVDRKPAVSVALKLKVQDMEGRTVERTVRSNQKLQVIMNAYYASVPDVAYGVGKFVYDGGQLRGEQTPAQLKMEDDDDEDGILIDFFIHMLGGGAGWAATAAQQPRVPAASA